MSTQNSCLMMSDDQYQSAKRKRKLSIEDLKCYETTNDFKESLEPSWNFINVFLDDGRKRITRGMLQKLNEQDITATNRESLLSNSVIVLNNTAEQTIVIDEETNNKDDQDVSIIECSSKPPLPLQQISQKKKLQNGLDKKKRSSIILKNNDLSDGHSADIHESIQSSNNGENIAPQMEDDIVELWSSLKPKKRKKATFKKRKCNKNNDICFVIDTKPDLKNLDCLKINVESASKKRKLRRKTTLAHNPVVLRVTAKQRHFLKTNKRYNNIYSNVKLTKVQFHKKEKKKEKCPALNEVSSSATSLVWNLASSSPSNLTSTSDSNSSSNKLREIIVDGSNVAMAYTHHKEFSEKGIQLVVDYFMTRGHVVKVFLPLHIRKKRYSFLEEMYKKGVVVFTPSRNIKGRQITPYDDRYILEYATSCEGVVISADQYRDLYEEKPEWRDTIANRLLMPTFVGDRVMFPEDPLGRFGPNLHTFLRY